MPSKDYIEKIIQKPISLPAIDQRAIDNFLDTYINKLFDRIKPPKEEIEKFEENFPYIYQTQLRKLFKTLRHAKRYLNALQMTLPSIKNEVNLQDFFMLEVIRVFYPKVYNDIWQNPWFYIPLNWSDSTYFLYPFNALIDENEKYVRIKEHIESILKNEKNSHILEEVLKKVFFVEVENALGRSRTDHSNMSKSYRAEKRITHPACFKKYFMLQVMSQEISDEFIIETLDLWHTTDDIKKEAIIENTFFEIQKKGHLLEFIKMLMVFIDKIDKKVASYITKVIYKNANRFSKKGTENLWNSEYDKSESLLLWLINDKVDKNSIQNTLMEIIRESPSIPFVVRTVLSCKKERQGSLYNIYDSINIESLQDMAAKRLQEYFIDGSRNIFNELRDDRDWGFVLYQWTTNWMTFKGNNKKIVNDYIFSIIKNNVKQFAQFLVHQKQKAFSDMWTFNLDEISKAYNIEELYDIAMKHKHDNSLAKEEKEYLEMFINLYKTRIANDDKNNSNLG